MSEIAIEELTETEARAELARLSLLLAQANEDYHQRDAPDFTDAEYDRLKRRNVDIETKFPQLKRSDSPSEQVGAPVTDGFSKVAHAVRMLSLSNAFDDEDVLDFDTSIRRYLGLADDHELAYTAEPKIDGLSLSLRYENGRLVQAATRGDGAAGENVIANALTIKDIPQTLSNAPDIAEIRGEVYMSHEDLSLIHI